MMSEAVKWVAQQLWTPSQINETMGSEYPLIVRTQTTVCVRQRRDIQARPKPFQQTQCAALTVFSVFTHQITAQLD